ncbi:terminase large subunit [Alcaligenaceae bacterium 429]|uniref:terminase large subunit n=1 Tax=Paenalcaligenes suwonensis TaxID=1202713 RepID=UPI001092D6B7|nr:terminase TerL endonuclease subunit [Paenalcaligenes suwonensis]NHC63095.1 terminase large subunit [Paenalcaligenes suwonensis]TGV09437.1 terminase large subunit [Alcaligenaceae bacterium 429]
MSKAKFPRVAAATQFARDVVRGKIPCCRYITLACQRHLDEIVKSKKRDFPYKFDPAQAEKKIKLIEYMPHTKGKWAREKKKIILEPWQLFGMACTFGWLRKKDGLRRFRESYWEVPRKNGKSVIAAGVGLAMFCADGEFGAEVYSGATTEKQAWEVFRPARLMVMRTPELKALLGIEVNAGNMNRPEDGSRFEPVIGNPGDGASPSCSIVDEYHEHMADDLYVTMQTGMGAREQPLMFIITTAGANISGPCYDKRQEVIEMLEGIVPNDELFGWIWTIDEGDDWTDPKVLAKANPNMGVSVNEDYLVSQQQQAIRRARFSTTFKNKHLNVWTAAKSGYFNMAKYVADPCIDRTLTLERFAGWDCVIGADLASKIDLTAMVPLFHEVIDGKIHYYCVSPTFWVPEDTVTSSDNRRMADRYQSWVASGHLIQTHGAEIDYRDILAEALEINAQSPVIATPLDPHGAANLSHQLDDEGLSPITIVQNFTNMSDPMKELEAAILSGRFHHDGNPIMSWCISNVVGRHLPGSDDIVRPTKQHTDNKIDGAVALIMAIGRVMLPIAKEETSIYEQGVGI